MTLIRNLGNKSSKSLNVRWQNQGFILGCRGVNVESWRHSQLVGEIWTKHKACEKQPWGIEQMEATFSRGVLGCPRKLGSMVSKWVITYLSWGILGVWPTYEPFTNLQGHPSRHLSNGLLYKPRSLFNTCQGQCRRVAEFYGEFTCHPTFNGGIFLFNGYSQPPTMTFMSLSPTIPKTAEVFSTRWKTHVFFSFKSPKLNKEWVFGMIHINDSLPLMMEEIQHQLIARWNTIYRVLYIPAGAGFRPSTVPWGKIWSTWTS